MTELLEEEEEDPTDPELISLLKKIMPTRNINPHPSAEDLNIAQQLFEQTPQERLRANSPEYPLSEYELSTPSETAAQNKYRQEILARIYLAKKRLKS